MKNKIKEMKDEGLSTGAIIAIFIIACIFICGIAFGLVCLEGWILMLLWNAIIPSLIGWGVLTFWQSVGLMLICNILFKTASSCTRKKQD